MQTLHLARALVKSLHTVYVACYFQFDEGVVREFEQSGSNVVLMNMKRGYGALRITVRLRQYFTDIRPDVVHVQYMAPGLLPVIAARLAGIKKVLATVHQPYTKWHGKHSKFLLRLAAFLCDHFISVSAEVEKSWFGRSSGDAHKKKRRYPHHFTLHNMVDVKRVGRLVSEPTEQVLTCANALTASFVFGYVGRIKYEKGVDILLDAFAIVAGNYDDIQLLIVGDGPELPALKKRYQNEHWWQKIIFTGAQPWENAIMHFTLMDTVVVPSRFEGFGLTAIEAMAASRPVIASDTGGLGEIIRHDETGILFKSGSHDKLSEAMQRLLDDAPLRTKLSSEARKRAESFNISFYNEKVNFLYRSL